MSDFISRYEDELLRAAERESRRHSHRPALEPGSLRRWMLITGICLAVAAPAAAAAGVFKAFPWQEQRGIVHAVQPAQARNFVIFDRPATSADRMPRRVADEIGSSAVSGRNIALSRTIATPTGRGWAVPGNGDICLVVPSLDGYGITCDDTAWALTHGAAEVAIDPASPSTAALTMLAPKGAQVIATLAGGETRELLPDADGVISARLPHAKWVAVRTSSGTARLDMPVAPRSAAN